MGGKGSGPSSTYTPELGAEICRRLASGESLRSICRDEGMPDESTVREWGRSIADFYPQYARAREDQMSSWGEEVLLIADDPSGDFNRDRLRVDTRKWLMSKIAPKVWGDRTVITGADDGPVRVESQDASALATALLGVLAKAGAEPKKEE